MAVVEVTARSTYSKGINEKHTVHVRFGTATCITVSRKKKRESGEKKLDVGSGKPFHGLPAEDLVRTTRKNTKSRECHQKEDRDVCMVSAVHLSFVMARWTTAPYPGK